MGSCTHTMQSAVGGVEGAKAGRSQKPGNDTNIKDIILGDSCRLVPLLWQA